MAIKYYCDACGEQLPTGSGPNKYSYRCHLTKPLSVSSGFADRDGNRVSGRDDTIDLCNRCYNDVVMPSIKKLREIQDKNGVSHG